jgi:hypothetical protein
MRRSRAWIAAAAGLAVIFVGCNGLARMEYFCSECATDRYALQLCLPKNRPILTLYSLETPSQFTTIKRSVEPARCEHRWVFASGKGGSFIQAKGSEARRDRLRLMDNQGIVTSAQRADAPGALELIRWCLRTDIPDEVFRSFCFGPDQRAVSFESEPAFRAWLDEFKRKVGGAP